MKSSRQLPSWRCHTYRLDSTPSIKYSFRQAKVVTSYQTFSEGVPMPATLAVAITQCTQTVNTRSVTLSLSRTPASSTPAVCRTYTVTLADMVRSDTTASSAALISTRHHHHIVYSPQTHYDVQTNWMGDKLIVDDQ
ncbi:hypothetical protein PspLS_11673 [Pyricularia sp. CBS 133598]|nr:hypothetical protein PspLS_11673 [Pyricularia sp. CBS 133598]